TSLRDRVKSYYPTKRVKRKLTFASERSAGNIGSVPRDFSRGRQALLVCDAGSAQQCDTRYFSRDIAETRGPKITRMLEQVRFVAYRTTDSVLEALILESNLIREHQPPYNTDAKDDKSYSHVVITEERFPRVLIVRGRDIEQKQFTDPVRYIFGPFPHGMQLREAMKIIRKLFPFRDRCVPSEELSEARQHDAKPCFNRQLGLCPGVCTGEITAREYAKTMRLIELFFTGRKSTIVRQLEREMKIAAKNLAFERANEIKKTLFGLKHIQDMALVKNESGIPARPDDGMNQESWNGRVEAYDVAHLGGDASVGVLVVLQDGIADKASYRKFILRGRHDGNDLTALAEILKRRLKHTEWPLPDIIVVDGGELQLGAAEKILRDAKLTIPIVGVVKNAKHQPQRLIGPESLIKRFKKEILLANSEAHRFAITFHRKRRDKALLPA
ncbi:MAG: UvrB/UvrC motif-containing protein, partial [Candidatus Moraniibacteriota bacterium]